MQSPGVGAGYELGRGVSMSRGPLFQCSFSMNAGIESPYTRIECPTGGTADGHYSGLDTSFMLRFPLDSSTIYDFYLKVLIINYYVDTT